MAEGARADTSAVLTVFTALTSRRGHALASLSVRHLDIMCRPITTILRTIHRSSRRRPHRRCMSNREICSRRRPSKAIGIIAPRRKPIIRTSRNVPRTGSSCRRNRPPVDHPKSSLHDFSLLGVALCRRFAVPRHSSIAGIKANSPAGYIAITCFRTRRQARSHLESFAAVLFSP